MSNIEGLETRRREVALMETTAGPTRVAASTMAVRLEVSRAELRSAVWVEASASGTKPESVRESLQPELTRASRRRAPAE
jgi:hypothetical protein